MAALRFRNGIKIFYQTPTFILTYKSILEYFIFNPHRNPISLLSLGMCSVLSEISRAAQSGVFVTISNCWTCVSTHLDLQALSGRPLKHLGPGTLAPIILCKSLRDKSALASHGVTTDTGIWGEMKGLFFQRRAETNRLGRPSLQYLQPFLLSRSPLLPPLLHSPLPSAIGESSRSPVKRAQGWCKMLAVTPKVLGAFHHLKLPKCPTFPEFSGGLHSLYTFF